MKIVIAGAGAIGGYIGARLARAGADVTLFARGAHLEAMRTRGLRVVGADEKENFEVRPVVTGSLEEIGQVDVVVVGVKAHGLTALAPRLRPLFGPDTVVVSTQNGIPWWYFQGCGGELDGLTLQHVDPGGVIGAAIEPHRVVGSIAYFAPRLRSRVSLDTLREIASRWVSRTASSPIGARGSRRRSSPQDCGAR